MKSFYIILIGGVIFSLILGFFCSNSMGGGDIIYILMSVIFHLIVTGYVIFKPNKKYNLMALLISIVFSIVLFESINYFKSQTEPTSRFE